MTDEVNFCPYCDAPQHKMLIIDERNFFCKSCNRFFTIRPQTRKCPKCSASQMTVSDFSSPTGGVIFQCKKCKKMFKMEEFLKD